MGTPNSEEVNGKIQEVLGALKEKVGHAISDKQMESEGAAERDAGDARHEVGKIERKIGEVVEDIGEFMRK